MVIDGKIFWAGLGVNVAASAVQQSGDTDLNSGQDREFLLSCLPTEATLYDLFFASGQDAEVL